MTSFHVRKVPDGGYTVDVNGDHGEGLTEAEFRAALDAMQRGERHPLPPARLVAA